MCLYHAVCPEGFLWCVCVAGVVGEAQFRPQQPFCDVWHLLWLTGCTLILQNVFQKA